MAPAAAARGACGGGMRPVLRLFGPLSFEDGRRALGPGDLGGTRPKQVLEILLAARGHRVSTDRLAELIWGPGRPQNAPGALQTFVSVLRRQLLPDRDRARALVVTEPEAYRVAIDQVALDLDCFDDLLERSAREPTRRARASLEQALGLVRGEVLEDEPYAPWALELRATYQGKVLGARLDAAEAALAELDFPMALAHAEAAAALDGFSERAFRTQMLALYALGRTHEALDRYRAFRLRLDEELGLEPAGETRTLESALIRQQDVHSLLPRPITRPHVDGGEHAFRLLGRSQELDRIAAAVREGLDGGLTLVHVEGEPGMGKTRLLDELVERLDGVRAGRAGATELERHLPYVPLATALRGALGDKVAHGPSAPAVAQVLPELSVAARPSEFEEVHVLEALVGLVAGHGPLVLVLDDLQWADVHTLAALGYLQRRGTDLAGVIVTAARPDTAEVPTLRGLRPDVVIRLEPLSAAELAPLKMPGLHESTGGNPRFVAEALAHGRDAGLSHSLADALVAQCRAEGPWGFRVLVAAAVLEPPFEPDTLARLLAVDAVELIEELERLCERRILRIDGFGFRFRYDLVRQALLASVSPARQRLLRERLDELAGETDASMLGQANPAG